MSELFLWILENPEIGWVATILYLIWEIRGPKGRIRELNLLIKDVVIVVRAMARTNSSIDEEKVDEFLTRNGHEPSDFFDFDSDTQDPLTDDKDLRSDE